MFVPVLNVEPPLDQSLVFGCECVCRGQPGTEELPDTARDWPGVRETPAEVSQVLQAE